MLKPSGVITLLTQDENDNVIIDFPSELFEILGWEEGDTLDIQVFGGRIVISKVAGGETEGRNCTD